MRPLMELLEDERMLILKQDTIYQNMLRYNGPEVDKILFARKDIVDRDLKQVRNEIREYIENLFNGSDE